MTKLTEGQMLAACRSMKSGGSFAAHIADAYTHADSGNRLRLVTAFGDLFQRHAPAVDPSEPEPAPPAGTKPSDYVAIRLWGQNLHSFNSYIEAEQAKALKSGAPVDALFERGGVWTTVRDLHAGHDFRDQYKARLEFIAATKRLA